MPTHIVQSPEWGEFKTDFGTKAIRVGEIQYTLHRLPFTNLYYGYCPKVDPFKIQWEPLTKSLKENGCFVINFDVPNIFKGDPHEQSAIKTFESQPNIKKSNKDTFTKNNVILDISKPEDQLFNEMHKKHRYCVRYALNHGIEITMGKKENEEDFETFFKLLQQTAERQKFLIHPKTYYQKIWEILGKYDIAHMLIAKYQSIPVVAWLLFVYDGVLYYPYGGSDDDYRHLQPSTLIGWEAIRLGKKYNCHTFDMWGAAQDMTNENDPGWGYTNFKIKFGGKVYDGMDSYDLVLNAPVYNIFNFVYPKVLEFLKALR